MRQRKRTLKKQVQVLVRRPKVDSEVSFTSWRSRDRNSMSWWEDSIFTSDSVKVFRSWSLA